MEELSGEGIVSSGLNWLKGLIPFGLGAAVLTGILKFFNTSEDSLYNKIPAPIRSVFDSIGNFFKDLWEKATGWFRERTSPEEVTAQNDFKGRLDRFDAITRIDQTLGLTGASTHIRELCKDAADGFFGVSMQTDPSAVLATTQQLQTQISEYLVTQLKAKNPQYTAQDLERYQAAATNAASYITGLGSDVGDNPNRLTQGFGGALMRMQTEVKKDGDYRMGQAANGTVNESLLAQIRGILSGEIQLADAPAAPAPAGGPAPAANVGRG